MVAFSELADGELFLFGQIIWRKCSTRTARIVENDRVFYFGQGEMCRRWKDRR